MAIAVIGGSFFAQCMIRVLAAHHCVGFVGFFTVFFIYTKLFFPFNGFIWQKGHFYLVGLGGCGDGWSWLSYTWL